MGFAGMEQDELEKYIYLTSTATAAAPEQEDELVERLWEDLLSRDQTRLQSAVGRIPEDGKRSYARRLVRVLQNSESPFEQRVSAGDALAHLSDPRFRQGAFYLPDEPLLGFVEIQAGTFTMGTPEDGIDDLIAKFGGKQEVYLPEVPQHSLDIPRYYICRYPVTVAQFRFFVEESGYKDGDPDSLKGLSNHPVVYVSWHDALAYCRWLTDKLTNWEGTPEPLRGLLNSGEDGASWVVTLPSEAEWEKAARGTDGRHFPWGEDIKPNLANYGESNLDGTSAVGCFPGGASPYEVLDLSGNTYEWTRSLWGESPEEAQYKYPYDSSDGREDLDASGLRVLRGGAFDGSPLALRCAARGWYDPGDRHYLVGFRVVVSPS